MRTISSETKTRRTQLKGIYFLCINKKYYIGKDAYIESNVRIKDHLRALKLNKHYNRKLQNAYNKYLIIESGIIWSDRCTLDELAEKEIEIIKQYNSYNNGYNLTTGGEGGRGIKFTSEQLLAKSKRVEGEKNPQAKLTDKQFFEIVEHLKNAKTNTEIANLYNLHERYVSLIRHKKRFKSLWKQVDGYTPIKSEAQLRNRGKVTHQMFLEIVALLEGGVTNALIERTYSLSSGTASRIRHRKLYKQWWKRLDLERSTTIPFGGEIPQ